MPTVDDRTYRWYNRAHRMAVQQVLVVQPTSTVHLCTPARAWEIGVGDGPIILHGLNWVASAVGQRDPTRATSRRPARRDIDASRRACPTNNTRRLFWLLQPHSCKPPQLEYLPLPPPFPSRSTFLALLRCVVLPSHPWYLSELICAKWEVRRTCRTENPPSTPPTTMNMYNTTPSLVFHHHTLLLFPRRVCRMASGGLAVGPYWESPPRQRRIVSNTAHFSLFLPSVHPSFCGPINWEAVSERCGAASRQGADHRRSGSPPLLLPPPSLLPNKEKVHAFNDTQYKGLPIPTTGTLTFWFLWRWGSSSRQHFQAREGSRRLLVVHPGGPLV